MRFYVVIKMYLFLGKKSGSIWKRGIQLRGGFYGKICQSCNWGLQVSAQFNSQIIVNFHFAEF